MCRFQRGAIDGSISLPDTSTLESDATSGSNAALQAVLNEKSKVKVVVGSKAHPGMPVCHEYVVL